MSQPPHHSRFINAGTSNAYTNRDDQTSALNSAGSLHEPQSDTDVPLDQNLNASIPLRASVAPNAKRVAFGDRLPRPDRDTSLSSDDDEVPHSLMIEASPAARRRAQKAKSSRSKSSRSNKQPLLPITHVNTPLRPSEIEEEPSDDADEPLLGSRAKQAPGLSSHEQALWSWVNVSNLDGFLQEVYTYYQGNGIYSIILSRGLNLLTVGFVIAFSTFLFGCIDYSRVPDDGNAQLSDVIIDHCISRFSGFTLVFFSLFGAFYVWQIITFVLGIPRLAAMHRFYTHLLNVPNEDIQTISWPEIVRRISVIRNDNPITAISSAAQQDPDYAAPNAKLDAHDVANRIMRQENYLISLFNKDLLDLRLPLPAIIKQPLSLLNVYHESKRGTVLTRALECNLRFCLMDYLFDRNGRVRESFLKDRNRALLVKGLRTRFIFMGCVNALFVPFIVPYLLIYSFFRYFEEAKSDPSAISSRRYTPYAEWKFREFNELPHLFHRRLDTSYPTANMYLDQFPKENVAHLMRFVSFVAGSFAAVLLLASLIDPHFEITPHRTVIFYLGVFGAILAVARGMIPDSHNVFDPEILMREVIRHTHYMPAEWKDALHSKRVHGEFGVLFVMKAMIFIQEILGVVLTPLVLLFSLPDCAPAIVDFFREFTVHVDGLGYVCSFAVFDFKRHGNVNFGAPTEQADERLQSKDGKMEKSFLAFKAAHPDWNPRDEAGSLYLSRLADLHENLQPNVRQSTLMRAAGGDEGGLLASGVLPRSIQAERSMLYEKALQQSMASAARRRAGLHMSSMGGSTMNPGPSRGRALAEIQAESLHEERSSIMREDEDEGDGDDGGIGGSYDDDVRMRGGQLVLDSSDDKKASDRHHDEMDELEAEELANGGVLGLLAQIYDRRRPPRMM